MEFNGEKITTLPPRKGDNLASGSVDVLQQLVTAANKTYVIQYSMRRNASGEWKLRNLIIDGINLGLIYRNQFTASAEINKGDIDKVIASWKLDPTVSNNKTPNAKEMVK
jgi:phospholipid transport system substrate-binding protein